MRETERFSKVQRDSSITGLRNVLIPAVHPAIQDLHITFWWNGTGGPRNVPPEPRTVVLVDSGGSDRVRRKICLSLPSSRRNGSAVELFGGIAGRNWRN